MSEVICGAKHTTFQPTDDQWHCPGCGKGSESFAIDENAEGSNDDCVKLHADDTVHCYACEFTASGASLAKRMMKALHRQICPTCKGEGTVPAKA